MHSRTGNRTSQVQVLDPPTGESREIDGLSTSHLDSGTLLIEPGGQEAVFVQPDAALKGRNTDWLRMLSDGSEQAFAQADEQPAAPPQPTGMAEHSRPPRITATLGTRLRVLLKRGLLISIISVASVGVLGGGVYALSYTPWLASTPLGQGSEASGEVSAPANKTA